MKYSDNDRLIKILEKGRELQKYLQDNSVTSDDLINTVSLQWLVTTPLYNIGECVCLATEKT